MVSHTNVLMLPTNNSGPIYSMAFVAGHGVYSDAVTRTVKLWGAVLAILFLKGFCGFASSSYSLFYWLPLLACAGCLLSVCLSVFRLFLGASVVF